MDNAWEQRKLEASLPWRAVQGKILAVGGGESHLPKRSEGEHALLVVFVVPTIEPVEVNSLIFFSWSQFIYIRLLKESNPGHHHFFWNVMNCIGKILVPYSHSFY